MKALKFTLLLTLAWSISIAQNRYIDSLTHQLILTQHDTDRVLIMAELCFEYRLSKPNSAMKYGEQALSLSQRIQFPKGEASALSSIGFVYRSLGDLQQSLAMQLKALSIAEHNIYSNETGKALLGIGAIYSDLRDYSKALNYHKQSLAKYELNNDKKKVALLWVNMGDDYEKMNQLDSALYFTRQGHKQMSTMEVMTEKSYAHRVLSKIYSKLNRQDLALNTAQLGIREGINDSNSHCDLIYSI